MHKEIYKKIVERQIQGVMFHGDLADYYAFLHLDMFRDFHNRQFMEECETLREIKDYFIGNHSETLIIDHVPSIDNITPMEWEHKTSLDVDESASKILLKQSLELYCQWEKETHKIYQEAADELFEHGYYKDYCFIQDIADDVNEEITRVTQLMVHLQSVGYDITRSKKVKYMLKSND